MSGAIGSSVVFAIGVATSPIPIVAIILVLMSARASRNGPAFLAGWTVGIAAGCVVLLVLAGSIDNGSEGTTARSATLRIVLGVVLLALAGRSFMKRPRPGEEPDLPKWMDGIEAISPLRAAGLGVLLSLVNPKNFVLIAGGMAAVAGADLATAQEAVAVLVFVLVAISTVAAAVVVYTFAGSGREQTLQTARRWLEANNAVIMAVVLVVIGAYLLFQGVAAL